MSDYSKYSLIWSKLLAKAWSDPAFKKKLLKNPNKVLKEAGITNTDKVNYIIHENTPQEIHLVFIPHPKELSEAEEKEIAAGATNLERFSTCIRCCD